MFFLTVILDEKIKIPIKIERCNFIRSNVMNVFIIGFVNLNVIEILHVANTR